MHVFSNLVANLLGAVMNLWVFQAVGTKEKVAHLWSKVGLIEFITRVFMFYW